MPHSTLFRCPLNPSPFRHSLRLATLLFPPLGWLLLWRAPLKLSRRILGTIGIALFSLLYAALVIFLLVRFTGLQIEWRGGYIPALTYRKTGPDYEALEKQRARWPSLQHRASASAPTTERSPIGPDSAARSATGITMKRRFLRTGRPPACGCFGVNPSAEVMPHLRLPRAWPSRSNNAARRKSSPHITWRPDARFGRTVGKISSVTFTPRMAREPRPLTAKENFMPWEPWANCGASKPPSEG